MKVHKTGLDGVLLIDPPTVFEDHRGVYVEQYNEKLYKEAGIDVDFCQDENRKQLLVPPKHGLAHLILSESAIFNYKQSTYYDRAGQFTLMWNNPELGVWWPVKRPKLSKLDSGIK